MRSQCALSRYATTLFPDGSGHCKNVVHVYVAHEYLLAAFLQNFMAGDATRSLCGILVTRFLICNSPVLRHTRFAPVCCIYQARCMYVNV